MITLAIIGIIALLAGILFLSGEKNLRAMSESTSTAFNKVVGKIDEFVIGKRVGTGICLILAGLFILFIAYWIYVMAPQAGMKVF